MSLPRLRMLVTASSASAFEVNGRRLAVQLSPSSSGSGGSAGSGAASVMPAGVGGANVTLGTLTTGAV